MEPGSENPKECVEDHLPKRTGNKMNNPNMIRYVVGYMFDPNLQRVVLIVKNKPDWQRGCLNGVGGKIEEGETALGAMVREFHEETGVLTSDSQWTHYLTFVGRNQDLSECEVHYFWCIGNPDECHATTEEYVMNRSVTSAVHGVGYVQNNEWLIPCAIAHIKKTWKGCFVNELPEPATA